MAIAAALTLGNADGVWSNARDDGGNTNVSCVQYVGDNTVTITQGASVEDENDVRYGRSGDTCLYTQTELDKKSGFGFDGSDGDLIFEPGQVFLLGELTHYNRPIFAWHLPAHRRSGDQPGVQRPGAEHHARLHLAAA